MILDRFDEDAKRAVSLAQDAARGLGHRHVGSEHLLMGLVRLDDSVTREALATVGVTDTALTAQVESVMGTSAPTSGGSLPFDEQTRGSLEDAAAKAESDGKELAAPQHLLFALIDRPGENAMLFVDRLGSNSEAVRTALLKQVDPGTQGRLAPETGKELGTILIERGVLTAEQLQEALESEPDKLIGRALIDLGMIKERDLVAALASQIGQDFVDLESYPIDPTAARLIPAATAWRHHVIAIGWEDGRLLVAMSDPADTQVADEIRVVTNFAIQPVVALAQDIERAIRENLGAREDADEAAAAPPPPAQVRDAIDLGSIGRAEPWRGPDDRVLGIAVPVNPVLAVTDAGVFVAVSDLVAYPNGFRMTVTMRRPAEANPGKWFEAVSWQHRWQGSGIPELSPRALRIGIQFPGGERVDNLSFRDVPSHERPGPSMVSLGAQGSSGRVDVEYWVWPLPAEGDAAFFIEWPSEGVALARVPFDGGLLARAAKEAQVLWDEER